MISELQVLKGRVYRWSLAGFVLAAVICFLGWRAYLLSLLIGAATSYLNFILQLRAMSALLGQQRVGRFAIYYILRFLLMAGVLVFSFYNRKTLDPLTIFGVFVIFQLLVLILRLVKPSDKI